MATIRAKTVVKVKTASGLSLDSTFPKGADLIDVISHLIQFSNLDAEKAKPVIEKALSKLKDRK